MDLSEPARRERDRGPVLDEQTLLPLVLATLPVGVAVTDRAGDIVLVNAASTRIWGDPVIVSGRERWIQSKGYWHDTHERIPAEQWASARALTKGETSVNELIDIETYDGAAKTIQNSAAPIRNAQGLIVGSVIVNEDVTERVRAEQMPGMSGLERGILSARYPVSSEAVYPTRVCPEGPGRPRRSPDRGVRRLRRDHLDHPCRTYHRSDVVDSPERTRDN